MRVILKIGIATVLVSLLLLGVLLPGKADARTEARFEGRVGNTVFGNDIYSSKNIQTLFHQQTLDTSDSGHYNMNFPAFSGNTVLGPVSSGAEIGNAEIQGNANVLPFGPVNLAMPSISEDSTQTMKASQTGFFQSNYDYRPEANFGNVPLSTGYPTSLGQAITPAPLFGLSPLYPEQYDSIPIQNKLKTLSKNKPASTTTTASNQTASNQTTLNQPTSARTNQSHSIPINSEQVNSSSMGTIMGPDFSRSYSLNFVKPKNASSTPGDTPVIYPSYFDMADKNQPVIPNPGIGSYSTNGAGSTGASLTGPVTATTTPAVSQATNRTGNQTSGQTGNRTSGQAGNKTLNQTVKPTVSMPSGLTYADFNFDATTGQINSMPVVDRMWRNAHRGGMMGKAYAGDTSYPAWIDPYERPYDLPRIDELYYCQQSGLNMTVPGTQIMPRYWSLMF